jgi:hypothetical protein
MVSVLEVLPSSVYAQVMVKAWLLDAVTKTFADTSKDPSADPTVYVATDACELVFAVKRPAACTDGALGDPTINVA